MDPVRTTLIKILNGLLKPDQGMVTIDGEDAGHTYQISDQYLRTSLILQTG